MTGYIDTNGTFVNGQRVPRALLKEGDRLGVGRVELTVSRGTDDRPPDAAPQG